MIRLTPEEYAEMYGEAPAFQQPTESNYLGRTQQAFGAGIEKIKAGYEQGKSGGSPISAGLKYGAGAIEAAASPLTAALQPAIEPTLGAGVKYASNKISDIPAVQKFAMSQAGETTMRVAEDVGNAATIAGTVAGFAGAKAPKINLPKTNLAPQAGKQSANIMQRVARISKGKQAKFEKMSGKGVGEYLVERNIFGTPEEVVAKLYERFSTSKAVADEAFRTLPGTYAPKPVITMLKEMIARERKVSTPGAPSPTLGEIKGLVNAFKTKGGLTHEQINTLKRIYEKNVKTEYLRENKTIDVARATNLDSAVRSWQLNQAVKQGFKNLKEVNQETRLAKQLMDSLGAEQAGSMANNAVSITDWIVLSGGDPTAIAAFFTKKAFSSSRVQSAIAQRLARDLPKKGPVAAEMKPTEILALPAATSPFRSQMGSGQTIPVAPTGANMELTGKTGITSPTRAKPSTQPQPKIEAPKASAESTTIPKELQPLAAEAKKYKSAEEFVQAQGTPVYHGSNAKFDTFDNSMQKNGWLGKGHYFTPDKNYAKEAGKNIKEVVLDSKNPFVVKGNSPSDVLSEIKQKFPEADEFNIKEVLQKNGYDSIKFRHWDKGEMVAVFEPTQIKTKSQLTDLWNKINNK